MTITDMKIFTIIGLAAILLCVVGQVFVYCKVKYYLNLEKGADRSLSSHRRAQQNHYNVKQQPEGDKLKRKQLNLWEENRQELIRRHTLLELEMNQ